MKSVEKSKKAGKRRLTLISNVNRRRAAFDGKKRKEMSISKGKPKTNSYFTKQQVDKNKKLRCPEHVKAIEMNPLQF